MILGFLLRSDLAAYSQPDNTNATLQANGAGSVLSLPQLGFFSFPNGYGRIQVQAYHGGDVELPALTTSTGDLVLRRALIWCCTPRTQH